MSGLAVGLAPRLVEPLVPADLLTGQLQRLGDLVLRRAVTVTGELDALAEAGAGTVDRFLGVLLGLLEVLAGGEDGAHRVRHLPMFARVAMMPLCHVATLPIGLCHL